MPNPIAHAFATMALSGGVYEKTLSSILGYFSARFTLDTSLHITNDMQRGVAEKISVLMETATVKPEPEPPDPPEESRCKVIPFERVGKSRKSTIDYRKVADSALVLFYSQFLIQLNSSCNLSKTSLAALSEM